MLHPLTLRRARRPSRRALLLAAFAVLVTGASATAAVVARRPAVAQQGPLPVHSHKTGTSLLTDYGPPQETSDLPLTIPAGGQADVPILVYHYIRTADPHDNLAYNLSVDPGLFSLQMSLLNVMGAHPVTLATLMSALEGKVGLPPHAVVLTFDDGYADFATAAVPVLHRFHFVATDYVVGGFMGRPGYMTTDQVQEVDAAGMVVGAHTMHHVDLTKVGDPGAEIVQSKATLEALLGHSVPDFAYPYGASDPAVQMLVDKAGFREATSTVTGSTQSLAARFALPRMHVGGAPPLSAFAAEAGLPAPTADQRTEIVDEAETSYPPPPESATTSPPAGRSPGSSGGLRHPSGGGSGGGSGGSPATAPPASPTKKPCPLPPLPC